MAPPADAVLAFASGFPLILLGALLLFIRPRRTQSVYFGLFAVLWGLQVVTANYGRVFRDADTHATLLLVSHVFMIVATLFLTHFATRLRPDRLDWVPTTAIAAFGVAAFVAYLIDPALIVRSVQESATGGYTTNYGPLVTPLIQLPFYAAFVLALLLLYRDYRKARAGTARHRVRGIMLALLLFISYQFPRNALANLGSSSGLAQFASGAVNSTTFGTLLLVGAFALGTVILLTVALHAYLRPPPPETGDFVLLTCFVFPAGVATLEWVLTSTGFETLETLGFWRLVAVGILVFTLANYQLFDLDVRIKRFVGPSLAAALILFGVPLVLALAQGDFGLRSAFATLLPEFIAVGALIIFRDRIGEELFPASKKEDKGYAHQRHLELYKVALEDVLSRGGNADDRTLAGLRARYHISDDEHKVLAWMTTAAGTGKRQPAASVELLPGSVVLERYRIDRLLGEGTRRATYLATDTASRQLVAIKAVRTDALDGAAARLLVREARLVATLTHPNILAVFDVAEEPGVTLIVMDYADEGNLNDYLDRNGPMNVRDAVRFLSELLAGLDELHERGIIHRNLKPKNILLDADGTILISDLSAAYAADLQAEDELAANALQDLLYLSPEQLRGETPLPQSDLYVAAVLFHLALTGQYPLRIAGRSDAAIRSIILEQPPRPHLHDDHPEWIAPFLVQALAKAPQERFANAAAMRDALHQHAGIRATTKHA